MRIFAWLTLMIAVAAAPGCGAATAAPEVSTGTVTVTAEPLPSWADGSARRAILGFVDRVTRKGSADFVPTEGRIAVFDNDGTLWSEKPVVQGAFVADRVKTLAPQHPEWRTEEPFKSLLAGDMKGLAATGEEGLLKLLAATSTGMTTEEFTRLVEDWITTARDPRFGRPYTELIYQPMLELLQYLRANGFKTFIVSGGGADFMRPWAARTYGIPPEQVVGSRVKMKYEVRDGKPVLDRLPEPDLVDDGKGKPIGIQQVIGRRPLAAFGNSDGDFEMLEWTTGGAGPRFGLLVHHDDAEREWSYDRDASIGKLSRALDEAPKHGWVVVDMKREWKVVYPFEKR